MSKPYAKDWETLSDGAQYSKSLGLYYSNGERYDPTSAEHNGIAGQGIQLRQMIKELKASNNTGEKNVKSKKKIST